jgi:hypothetical protein
MSGWCDVHGYQIAKIASEIVRLSQEQVDLLEAVPINQWTETQQDGYRLRRQRITELSAELKDTDLSSAA